MAIGPPIATSLTRIFCGRLTEVPTIRLDGFPYSYVGRYMRDDTFVLGRGPLGLGELTWVASLSRRKSAVGHLGWLSPADFAN